MEKETVDHCPGCGSTDANSFLPFGRIDRYGYKVETQWCDHCQMVFINPRLSPQHYNDFYSSGTYGKIIETYSGKEQKKNIDNIPKRVSLIQNILPRLFNGQAPISILDIGGTNRIFQHLESILKIRHYVCINPDTNEIGHIADHGSFETIPATIEEIDIEKEAFDLVCMFGTLNHLMAPLDVFKKVAAALKPDGFFLLDHVNRVKKMAFARHPSFQIQIDHPVYPSSKTIYEMTRLNGLSIKEMHEVMPGVNFYVIGKEKKSNGGKFKPVETVTLKKLSKKMNKIPLQIFCKYFIARIFKVNAEGN